MAKTRRKAIIMVAVIMAFMIVIAALWISGVIPTQIGKRTAIKYVAKEYPEMEFVGIEWGMETHVATFKRSNGAVYYFSVGPWYWPERICFDPLHPPG